jgi:hypothetical protein
LLRFVGIFNEQEVSIGRVATEINELTIFKQKFFVRRMISAWVTTGPEALLLLLCPNSELI